MHSKLAIARLTTLLCHVILRNRCLNASGKQVRTSQLVGGEGNMLHPASVRGNLLHQILCEPINDVADPVLPKSNKEELYTG